VFGFAPPDPGKADLASRGPFVVLFEQDGADEGERLASSLGKMPMTSVRRYEVQVAKSPRRPARPLHCHELALLCATTDLTPSHFKDL
jgi:hypothetical protein